ncbi:hypothetical protein [Nostoc sp. UHCC 0870]|uniref:hypothetical protein n=1 Tax=Nostoc sp. UHCC 0870 TaxID=2914041 RepID=UPI001EDF1A86|nr:hypothetical protein [Nostoc sp. UHCC 0870]UKO99348.1 hypothetical protein L6494_06445 [Nostoc sp. UHCC 0870]
MLQENNQTTTPKTQINISPNVQDRVVEQILIQSGGIGLGILISLISSVLMAKWLGLGTFIVKFLERIDKSTESLTSLATSIHQVSKELDLNHDKYVKDHKDILDKVGEVKSLIKEDVMPALRDIERRLGN